MVPDCVLRLSGPWGQRAHMPDAPGVRGGDTSRSTPDLDGHAGVKLDCVLVCGGVTEYNAGNLFSNASGTDFLCAKTCNFYVHFGLFKKLLKKNVFSIPFM